MISSSLRVFFAVSLLRLACSFTELAVLLRRQSQRSTEPNTQASSEDTTYVEILDDFDPDDESVQFWLDSLSDEPFTHSNTCAHLDRCLTLSQSDGSHSEDC